MAVDNKILLNMISNKEYSKCLSIIIDNNIDAEHIIGSILNIKKNKLEQDEIIKLFYYLEEKCKNNIKNTYINFISNYMKQILSFDSNYDDDFIKLLLNSNIFKIYKENFDTYLNYSFKNNMNTQILKDFILSSNIKLWQSCLLINNFYDKEFLNQFFKKILSNKHIDAVFLNSETMSSDKIEISSFMLNNLDDYIRNNHRKVYLSYNVLYLLASQKDLLNKNSYLIETFFRLPFTYEFENGNYYADKYKNKNLNLLSSLIEYAPILFFKVLKDKGCSIHYKKNIVYKRPDTIIKFMIDNFNLSKDIIAGKEYLELMDMVEKHSQKNEQNVECKKVLRKKL